MPHYIPQDRFFKKAKEDGYRARSVYKLEEIQSHHHILKPGDKVLDLGAAPGSFVQFIGQIIGEKGLVIGIDLKPIQNLKKPNIKTYQGDIFDDIAIIKIKAENKIESFNVVTSDLAPATSGIKSLDSGRSVLLNDQVLNIAERYLKKGGNALMKVFPGADQDQLMHRAKLMFREIKVSKPEAVRKSSREIYIICKGKL